MRTASVWFPLVLMVAMFPFGQAPPATISAERLIDERVTEQARRGFSGSVLVVRGHQVLMDKAFGSIKGVAMTTGTLFWIASAGKQFTAAAMLLCAERGLVDLDAPLSRVFPEAPGDKRGITIRQLLSYTSGLPPSAAGELAESATAAVAEVFALPLSAKPGERFIYATANYLLAAAIVERITATPFSEFLRHSVFAPAHLDDTGQAIGRAALNVAPTDGELPTRLRQRAWNALGYFSTTHDLRRWMDALVGGAIVSAESVRAMWSPVAPIQEGHAALGWFVGATPNGIPRVFTRGNEDMGANSAIYFYPDTNTLIVVLTHAGSRDGDRSWSRVVHGVIEQALTEAPALHLEHVGANASAFHVVATLVVGPTEVVLWDAQYHVSDGKRLADRIAATGKRLKAIVLSHADHDHYMGAIEIVRRFPGTPVFMTPAGLADFQVRSQEDWKQEKARPGADPPDALVVPQPLPSLHLTVDGHDLEIVPDLTGDVRTASNSILWIPSLKTVLAGDVAFNGVHPWLGDSDMVSRAAWQRSVERIAAFRPAHVVGGHKKDIGAPDSPDVLDFMRRYLSDFDAVMQSSATAAELAQSMRARYPDLAVPGLVVSGSRLSFKK